MTVMIVAVIRGTRIELAWVTTIGVQVVADLAGIAKLGADVATRLTGAIIIILVAVGTATYFVVLIVTFLGARAMTVLGFVMRHCVILKRSIYYS